MTTQATCTFHRVLGDLLALELTCHWKLLPEGEYVPECRPHYHPPVGIGVDTWKVCPHCTKRLKVV